MRANVLLDCCKFKNQNVQFCSLPKCMFALRNWGKQLCLMAGIGCFPLICLTNYLYASDVTSEACLFELLNLYILVSFGPVFSSWLFFHYCRYSISIVGNLDPLKTSSCLFVVNSSYIDILMHYIAACQQSSSCLTDHKSFSAWTSRYMLMLTWWCHACQIKQIKPVCRN